MLCRRKLVLTWALKHCHQAQRRTPEDGAQVLEKFVKMKMIYRSVGND